jgi:hypothetical protein
LSELSKQRKTTGSLIFRVQAAMGCGWWSHVNRPVLLFSAWCMDGIFNEETVKASF